MTRPLSLHLALTATLWVLPPAAQTLAGSTSPRAVPFDEEQQVLTQGPMLIGSLRQARKEALQRDPWGMADSLQEARRVLNAMAGAKQDAQSDQSSSSERSSAGNAAQSGTVPLGEPMELDHPEPGGRKQAAGRFDAIAGSMFLKPMRQDIDRALAALSSRPQALGAALLATEDALQQVRWDEDLEPAGWAVTRDQVLEAYALALDSSPEAGARLADAHQALLALPGGEPFAQRLTALQSESAPDLKALSALVQELDAKVRSMREALEVGY